jgi:hypothetical protein
MSFENKYTQMISLIEQALQRVGDAKFQEFCDAYLYFKENPTSISPVGKVTGKDKSRKGIPDCFMVGKDGAYIFCEYTTQEKYPKKNTFLSKLLASVSSCFDTSKTKIKAEDVSKIILCYTSNLLPAERTRVIDEVKRHNDVVPFWFTLLRVSKYLKLQFLSRLPVIFCFKGNRV